MQWRINNMKTFYIPTSTLNFNNILSSESISPKAFYEKRGFGYSRWATIPKNPYANAVVLYENLCFFDRPKSDVEDHPLVVEVQLEESELKKKEYFWFTDHTIYLAPTTTRFLFFTEKDKTITLSMSENSSETKLMRLYTKIECIEKPSETYKPITTDEPCELNESEIKKDFRLNKMKGLLHGYYIGALLSTDLDSVKHLNILREIHNIFAAILSSFEKKPTPYQNERLDELFKAINRRSPDYQELFKIFGDADKIDKALALDLVKGDFVKKTDYLYYLQQDSKDVEKENPAIEWIKGEIKNVQNTIKRNSQLLQPDKSEIVVVDNKVSIFGNKNVNDGTEKDLSLAWFNKTLSSEESNGKISTYRDKLADIITDEAIEVLGDQWKESVERTYLNALRHHIAGEKFDQEWRNGLLSSIAAVVVAGDDWEKLLAFMQNKEMTDYSLAFAFYGELNGYANLLRDFTDLLYNQDSKYVREVYKEFYGQLYGKSLLETKKQDSYVIQQERETKVEAESSTEQKKREFSSPIQDNQTSLDSSISTELETKLQSLPWWNNKKTNRDAIVDLLKKLGPSKSFLTEVAKVPGVGKQKITGLQDVLGINKSNEISGNLFSSEEFNSIGEYFYCDKNAWSYLEPLIKDKWVKEKIFGDLKWLQDDIFAKPKGQRGYIYDAIDEKDNRKVIEIFYNFKRGKYDDGKEKAPYFTEDLRKSILIKLKELYHVE